MEFLGERFRILARLGEGGSGVVYRVHDRETGEEVALKTLLGRTPEDLYQLKEEFRSLRRVRHRNLVRLYDLVVASDRAFFTMELVAGVPPSERVRAAGVVDVARTIDFARQLIHGVAAIHAAGKLHRDIKPSNILVDGTDRVVILDFGFVAAMNPRDQSLVSSGLLTGTPAYMAPEQLWGTTIGPAADWYAVGIVLHELLTDGLPFAGTPSGGLAAKERAAPPPPSAVDAAVPPIFDEIVTAMLDPQAARRPGAADLLRLLDAIAPARASTQHAHAPTLAPACAAPPAPMLGRDAELEALGATLAAAGEGRALAAHLRGPSGIGKTALVARFLDSLPPSATVLRGRCHPYESMPYKALDPVVDELSRVLLEQPERERTRCVPEHAAELLRLFPVLARVPELAEGADRPDPGADDHEIRQRGFTAFRDLLARLAARGPIVVWIDDLQWGDVDSALLLRHVLHSAEKQPLLLIVSYRSGDAVPAVDALDGRNGGSPATAPCEIDLQPLDPAASTTVLRALRDDLPAELGARIVREAAGSPFLLTELARELQDEPREALPRDVGPRSVARLVDRRLREVPGAARALLDIVCVAGGPMDRDLLLEVAATGGRGRIYLDELEAENLVRSNLRDARPFVEIYHERIREELLARLPAERRRERHGQLADALLRAPAAEPEALLCHLVEAGRATEAATYAIQAAERASATLAFIHAARLYERALELLPADDARRGAATLSRAQALVNAGHGRDAAPLLLDAATHAIEPADALDLRRQAAEQMLVSGHFDDGLALLRDVLLAAGVRYPETPARAIAAVGARLLLLRLRGTGFVERGAMLPPREGRRIELCFSASKGHIVVDPAKGAYFALLGLVRSLAAGDAHGVARGLAVVSGAFLVPAGGPLGRWGNRLLERAREIAVKRDDPYLRGIVAIATGQMLLFSGRWRDALAASDEGGRLMRDHCRGVAWECAIGQMGAIRAAEELGNIGDMLERATEMLRDGEGRGDLYAEVTGHNFVGTALVAQGHVDEARAHAARTRASWTSAGVHVPQVYATRIDAYCDLRTGHPEHALRSIEDLWPALRRSGLLRVPISRLDAFLLRGHALLALVAARPATRPGALQRVEALAAQLARGGRADMVGHAAMLRASAATLCELRADAAAHLETAMASFARADMKLAEELARCCLGSILGGERGRPLVQQASAAIRALGIPDVPGWVRVQAPGFDSTER